MPTTDGTRAENWTEKELLIDPTNGAKRLRMIESKIQEQEIGTEVPQAETLN